MKRIQVGIAALSVLVAGAAASGFKTAPKAKKFSSTGWFQYTGANQTAASFNTTSNYTFFGTTPPTCSSNTKLCAISVIVTSAGTHIQTGTTGSFGAPMGTHIASGLLNSAEYQVVGPNRTTDNVLNKD